MVREGILLGHHISGKGSEVDQAKVEIIEKLLPPTSVKCVVSLVMLVSIEGSSGTSQRSPSLCLTFSCKVFPLILMIHV